MQRVIRLKFLRPPPDGWHITAKCKAAYEIRPTIKVTKSVFTRWRRRVVGKDAYPDSLLITALSRGEWATTRPGRLYPVEKAHHINWIEGGVAPGPVWTFGRWENCVAPAWDSNLGSPSQWPSHYTDNAIRLQEGLNMAIKCIRKLYSINWLHKNPKELPAGIELFCFVNNTMRE
jgi:hypothetical protein